MCKREQSSTQSNNKKNQQNLDWSPPQQKIFKVSTLIPELSQGPRFSGVGYGKLPTSNKS